MAEQRPDYLNDALEMMGIDLDAPKQIIQEVSGFTPMFDAVVSQYKDETRAAVHGAMWRFCQMEDGVCKAALGTIAEMIGVDIATVKRHAEALCTDGYFKDLTPDLRNRPHVYVDTGKIVMKSKLTAGFAQSKATIAQSKATIAESRLSKDLNKDSNKLAATAANLSIENQIAMGVETVTKPDETVAKMKDTANLISTGMGALASLAYDIAMAFQQTRQIVIPESKVKAQRKAIREMLEMGVKAEHVRDATDQLVNRKMTVTDLYSVIRTAVDLANKPAPEMTRLL